MSTFSTLMENADTVIFALLGVSAVYTKPGFAGTAISVILDHNQELTAIGPGELSEHIDQAILRPSQLTYEIERGDQLEIDSTSYEIDRISERDQENATVTVELKRL